MDSGGRRGRRGTGDWPTGPGSIFGLMRCYSIKNIKFDFVYKISQTLDCVSHYDFTMHGKFHKMRTLSRNKAQRNRLQSFDLVQAEQKAEYGRLATFPLTPLYFFTQLYSLTKK